MAKFSSVNTIPATGPLAMYTAKTVLVSAGWTVIRSGDGLSAYSASGDIITTGGVGAGGLGQARAYFEIRDAVSRVAISFQMITDINWRVKYTELGVFAGGSPNSTTVGSATDEQVLYGAGTDASPTGTQMLHTNALYRFHVVANSTAQTGSGTFPFWFGCTVLITGVTASCFVLEGMANGTYHALDQAPRIIITWYVGTGPVASGWANSVDTTQYARGWVLYGLSGATFKRFNICYYGVTNAGGTYLGNPTATATFLTSPYSPEDQPLPMLFAREANHGTLPGPKGFAADIKVGTQLPAARYYPITILNATNAYVYFGGALLPWPESISASL